MQKSFINEWNIKDLNFKILLILYMFLYKHMNMRSYYWQYIKVKFNHNYDNYLKIIQYLFLTRNIVIHTINKQHFTKVILPDK